MQESEVGALRARPNQEEEQGEEVRLSASPGRPPSTSPVLFSSEDEDDAEEASQAAASFCDKVVEALESPAPEGRPPAVSAATEEPEKRTVSHLV